MPTAWRNQQELARRYQVCLLKSSDLFLLINASNLIESDYVDLEKKMLEKLFLENVLPFELLQNLTRFGSKKRLRMTLAIFYTADANINIVL